MRRLGFSSYIVRAQDALFVVDTDDLIDRALALEGIWEAEQLEDFAAVCRRRQVDYFLDIGANTGVYSILLASKGLVRRTHRIRARPRQLRALCSPICRSIG